MIDVDPDTHIAKFKFDPEITSVEEIKELIEGWEQPGEKFHVRSYKYLK